MHKVAPAVEQTSGLPVLHIGDAAGAAIRARGLHRVGLLGTAFTMEEPFLKDRLAERFGLEVVVPGEVDRRAIHRIIYEELVIGDIQDASRHQSYAIIDRLLTDGVEGIVLGCTEIGLLVQPEAVAVPVFDTTCLHAQDAVAEALAP